MLVPSPPLSLSTTVRVERRPDRVLAGGLVVEPGDVAQRLDGGLRDGAARVRLQLLVEVGEDPDGDLGDPLGPHRAGGRVQGRTGHGAHPTMPGWTVTAPSPSGAARCAPPAESASPGATRWPMPTRWPAAALEVVDEVGLRPGASCSATTPSPVSRPPGRWTRRWSPVACGCCCPITDPDLDLDWHDANDPAVGTRSAGTRRRRADLVLAPGLSRRPDRDPDGAGRRAATTGRSPAAAPGCGWSWCSTPASCWAGTTSRSRGSRTTSRSTGCSPRRALRWLPAPAG